jgi:hypothetical protein
MNAVKIQIKKTSIVNTAISTAKKLAIPFDGVVYASILYVMDHGLKKSDIYELYHSEDSRTMFLSEYMTTYIKTQAEKMRIDDTEYVKKCLDQIIWINNSDEIINEYYRKKSPENIARKISKTN